MSQYTDLFMNNLSAELYMEMREKDFQLDRPLKSLVVENGYILPSMKNSETVTSKLWAIGGVADEFGKFIPESEMGMLWGGEPQICYDLSHEEIVDEEVIFMGPFVEHWGHFICDEISRLWYFCKNGGPNFKIAYCSWLWGNDVTDYKLFGNYLELMHLIGIADNQLINITKPTRFKKIIIPERSFVSGEYYTQEYKLLIDTIIKNASSADFEKYSKVYFTRQRFADAKNKEYGEDDIVSFFEKNGYKILSPELLSVKEQIFYFQNCESIAMISGTIAHNLLFASSELNATILNKFSIINDYQIIVDHISKASITYINAFCQVLPVLFGVGPFWLVINKHFRNWAKKQHFNYLGKRRNLKGYIWYIKQWKKQYIDNPVFKELLKTQQKSLKKKKHT